MSSTDSASTSTAPKRKPPNRRDLEKRKQQNKAAQEKYRERRVAQVTELETKVAQLTAALLEKGAQSSSVEVAVVRERLAQVDAENAGLRKLLLASDAKVSLLRQRLVTMMTTSTVAAAVPCPNCQSVQPLDALGSLDWGLDFMDIDFPDPTSTNPQPRLSDLELLELLQNQQTESPASSSFASTSTAESSSISNLQPANTTSTSTQLFGPIETESARIALKTVPGISQNVDEILDVILQLSTEKKRETIQSLMVRFITLKHKLLDSCTLLDRRTVIEVMEKFKTQNHMHLSYFYKSLRSTSTTATPEKQEKRPFTDRHKQILRQFAPFKEAIKTIPSLAGSQDLIQQLCDEFSHRLLCTDAAERDAKFVHINYIMGQLQEKCATEEDRTNFMLALELARESNKKQMDDLIQSSLAASTMASTALAEQPCSAK
ncbi:UNVERIFIED_CONTAM: hypothetical protein HDU68_009850 [Siphonaria sp. JEL0065]|nr:hypothetical protein HDU68_009850 [Siphonaria sp. JEL0065]